MPYPTNFASAAVQPQILHHRSQTPWLPGTVSLTDRLSLRPNASSLLCLHFHLRLEICPIVVVPDLRWAAS